MTILVIAWRNIWRNKRRSFLSLLAVALSCALLVFMMAMQKGSYAGMINSAVRAHSGHIQVQHRDYFEDRDESILPVKPLWWLHTSGRSGEFRFKWAPYTPLMAKRLGETTLGLFTFARCSGRGEFPFEEGERMLYAMASLPYFSGGIARAVIRRFDLH